MTICNLLVETHFIRRFEDRGVLPAGVLEEEREQKYIDRGGAVEHHQGNSDDCWRGEILFMPLMDSIEIALV